MSSPLDEEWPSEDLEWVHSCPYCACSERALAYGDVRDWSFRAAAGAWNYWDCVSCGSLYLDPRPTQSSIGSAYATYYTHGSADLISPLRSARARLRNECLSQKLYGNIGPRLHLPAFLNGLLALLGERVEVPFGWMQLATLPRGRFIDVGSGAGRTVAAAQQLGWDATGLEIDPAAVATAQRSGVNVLQGSYEELKTYDKPFDCIMCSHVLEHVHYPLDLLARLRLALKPGGVLLLTLPNSLSALRRYFGPHWRGLEAPRHLSIPAQPQLMQLMVDSGYSIQSLADNKLETAAESYRILRRGLVLNRHDLAHARKLDVLPLATPAGNDLIKFVCKKSCE